MGIETPGICLNSPAWKRRSPPQGSEPPRDEALWSRSCRDVSDQRLTFLLKRTGARFPAPALDELGSLYSSASQQKKASYSRRKPLTRGWWEEKEEALRTVTDRQKARKGRMEGASAHLSATGAYKTSDSKFTSPGVNPQARTRSTTGWT